MSSTGATKREINLEVLKYFRVTNTGAEQGQNEGRRYYRQGHNEDRRYISGRDITRTEDIFQAGT